MRPDLDHFYVLHSGYNIIMMCNHTASLTRHFLLRHILGILKLKNGYIKQCPQIITCTTTVSNYHKCKRCYLSNKQIKQTSHVHFTLLKQNVKTESTVVIICITCLGNIHLQIENSKVTVTSPLDTGFYYIRMLCYVYLTNKSRTISIQTTDCTNQLNTESNVEFARYYSNNTMRRQLSQIKHATFYII